MTILYRYTIRLVLILRFYFHRLTRTGCFGSGQARFFIPAPADKKGASLKAGLFRHHVKQFHDSSCSVASVVCAVNTLAERQKGASASPITQAEILDRVTEAHWKERMGPNGHNGRRGLPLEVLGRVVRASLKAYGIRHAGVDAIRAERGKKAVKAKNHIIECLTDFQTRDQSLVIAHFDQGSFVRELNIPHISPVGGCDPDTGRVTILDVDPTQPRPYTIPFSRFYKGISTSYGGLFTPFGYGRGGIVVIHLDQR